MRSRDRELLTRLFQIDGRSLALVRIGLAGLALLDLATRAADPTWGPEWLSIAGPAVGIAAASSLAVGYHSRAAAALLWAVYGWPVRLAILPGGPGLDLGKYILTLLLFWFAFLPSGITWGIDGRRRTRTPLQHLSIGSAGLLIQVFLIYFSAGITKDAGEWLVNRTALETLLSNPRFASDLGLSVARHTRLMGVSSVAVVVLEVLGSLALFLPIRRLPVLRTVLAACFVAFHIGIAAFMDIGFFPYVMIVVWLAFLPSELWEKLQPSHPAATIEDRQPPAASALGAAALVYVVVSNAITLTSFPVQDGWMASFQTAGRYLLLYQQWLMFSVPSSFVVG